MNDDCGETLKLKMLKLVDAFEHKEVKLAVLNDWNGPTEDIRDSRIPNDADLDECDGQRGHCGACAVIGEMRCCQCGFYFYGEEDAPS